MKCLDLLQKMDRSSWSAGFAEDRYKPSKQVRFKKSMLWSDLRDFSDAYFVVKGTITVTKN